ncbi:hypothetical protein [Rhizobium sp. Root482]|uniref:hypothetical protein n=1 Tax=Rhizobium sp. Root482 TaxID=1736543 RepID=UPI0006FBF44F|nr:hypothetical protein [Rhizobium sp. Root482]KQY26906.1 hypothetical protein ASD31_01560 [Rhizobium sp. Root482]
MMATHSPYADVLCSEDIDLMRLVFEEFCRTHRKPGSDEDMQRCASTIMRLYRAGERDAAVLKRACETTLQRDLVIDTATASH